MDNASYHHEMNRNYYPAGLEISNCSKAWHAHVLRLARCRSIGVQRGQLTPFFDVPEEEPPGFQEHRELKTKVPQGKFEGTVYERKSRSGGISADELKDATIGWLKENKPEALQSKVELLFREKGWKIIWTPPYCPKFQPIELVWGAGKQRVAWGYFGSRNLEETRNQLRIGFYGGVIGEGNRERKHSKVDIAGCWKKAKGELNAWISKDCENIGVSGLSGDLDNLVGASNWTNSTDDCLDIQDYW